MFQSRFEEAEDEEPSSSFLLPSFFFSSSSRLFNPKHAKKKTPLRVELS